MGVVMGLSMIRRFAVLVVVLSLAPWLQADPVWEVSKDGKRIRLGATVHFLRQTTQRRLRASSRCAIGRRTA